MSCTVLPLVARGVYVECVGGIMCATCCSVCCFTAISLVYVFLGFNPQVESREEGRRIGV